MPKLKVLSGKDVVKIFTIFGFQKISQKGSHIKLGRFIADKSHQTITFPLHRELDKGTLRAIFTQALRFMPEEQLKPHFYG